MAEIPDAETQEILKNMKEEGVLPEEETPDSLKEPKPNAEEPKPKDPPAVKPAVSPKPADVNDDDDDDDEDEDDKSGRPKRFMPLSKYNKRKEKFTSRITELEQENERLRNNPPAPAAAPKTEDPPKPELPLEEDPEVISLAEEYGLDPKVVAGIVKLGKTKAGNNAPGIDPKLAKGIEDIMAEREQNKLAEKHEKLFNEELAQLIKENPDEPIADLKEELKELAFSKDHNKKSLYEIYFRVAKPEYGTRKTAEASKGGTGREPKIIDFDKIADDAEAIDKLSDEDFEKFSTYMESKDKPKITRAKK